MLSGPFYLTPSHPDWNVWQDWYHTDPANFSAESEWQQQYVLGGMGTIWSDLVKDGIVHQAWPVQGTFLSTRESARGRVMDCPSLRGGGGWIASSPFDLAVTTRCGSLLPSALCFC